MQSMSAMVMSTLRAGRRRAVSWRSDVGAFAVTGIVNEILALFARFGAERYGEDLSIERHMLQTAALARSLGAPANVVVAALLHDVGHFLHADGQAAAVEGRDIEHEALGAAWLSRAFDVDITAPIALHVRAKRYLCAVELGYLERLSAASRLSLAAQGGPMSSGEAAAFTRESAFEAAVILRRCDDGGKDASIPTPDIESFRGLLTASLRPSN
jgi:predicted HD phosphohydrolase